MSKMDGYASRTATDLERKYNFGQTFAEVYGLVSDARKIAEEAQSAFEGLNQEQIFNLLTNFGEAQGIYRDDAGGVYINASYIKSGTISGDNVKVAAATVTGELSAATITADKISGGTLDFNNVTAKNLEVTMAQISDLSSLRITADVISGGTLDFDNIFVKNLEVNAANITGTLSADMIRGGTLSGVVIQSTGRWGDVVIENSRIAFGTAGWLYGNSSGDMYLQAPEVFRIYLGDYRYYEISGAGIEYYRDGEKISYANFIQLES